ncbi:MAG: FG-GAP repeat domain-containing protein [Pyrinomonadaceae bacterium]
MAETSKQTPFTGRTQKRNFVSVKKTSMIISFYSKFEIRFLIVATVLLIAFLFAVSAAKGAASNTADLAVVNPNTNVWKMRSCEGEGSFAAVEWGLPGDVRVPADYDGDGIKDVAVWRPSNGNWYILRSRDGMIWQLHWGQTTRSSTGGIEDIPVPADFDGDNIDDIAIWRPSEGRWYVLTSKTGFNPPSASITEWGLYGDIPVPADYDGDGRTDAAVFRSTQNRWYIAQSKTGNLDVRNFGIAGSDLLVPADYTGDGRADLAVFRSGVWFVQDYTSHETDRFEFGFTDSQPVPADYDGDGTTDFAVYRRGTWYIHDSNIPRLRSISFGGEEEFPLNSLSVKPSIIAAR